MSKKLSEDLFVEKLESIIRLLKTKFPVDDDIATIKNKIKAAKSVSAELILMSDVGSGMLPYKQQILSGDINFFMSKDNIDMNTIKKSYNCSDEQINQTYDKIKRFYSQLSAEEQKYILTKSQEMLILYESKR